MDRLEAAGENTVGQRFLGFAAAEGTHAERKARIYNVVTILGGSRPNAHLREFLMRLLDHWQTGQPYERTYRELAGVNECCGTVRAMRDMVALAVRSGVVRAEPRFDPSGRFQRTTAYCLLPAGIDSVLTGSPAAHGRPLPPTADPCRPRQTPAAHGTPLPGKIAGQSNGDPNGSAPRAHTPIQEPKKQDLSLQEPRSKEGSSLGEDPRAWAAAVGSATAAAIAPPPAVAYDQLLASILQAVPELRGESEYAASEAARRVALGIVPKRDLDHILVAHAVQRHSARGATNPSGLFQYLCKKQWPDWPHRKTGRPREPSEPP